MQLPSASETVDALNWFQRHTGYGWTLSVVEFALVVGHGIWFYTRRYVPLRNERDSLKQRHAEGATAAGPGIRGLVIKSQGTGQGISKTTISGASVIDFADSYGVAVVAGIDDPARDKFEDRRIAISALHTIAPVDFEIVIPHSPQMIAVLHDALEAAKAAIKASNPEIRPGTKVMIPVQTAFWHETVLLPRGFDTLRIQTLADVQRFNGKILSVELGRGRIKQIL